MGMDMHTGILYVHTHVNWSVQGARDAEARKGLCVCMCSLCVHLFVFVCVHDRGFFVFACHKRMLNPRYFGMIHMNIDRAT